MGHDLQMLQIWTIWDNILKPESSGKFRLPSLSSYVTNNIVANSSCGQCNHGRTPPNDPVIHRSMPPSECGKMSPAPRFAPLQTVSLKPPSLVHHLLAAREPIVHKRLWPSRCLKYRALLTLLQQGCPSHFPGGTHSPHRFKPKSHVIQSFLSPLSILSILGP